MTDLKSYRVWDANVRWFHWINVLCILGLVAVGVVILNDKALGVSTDGKILLKTVHVLIGYVFALNLLWRLVWAFIGGVHARWRGMCRRTLSPTFRTPSRSTHAVTPRRSLAAGLKCLP